jgi:acyl carrier protein
MKIVEDVERLLLSEIAVDTGKQSLTPDEDLLGQGIIDSLGIIKLIEALEATFGIKIVDEEVVPDNFQTVASIARFVEQKKQAR